MLQLFHFASFKVLANQSDGNSSELTEQTKRFSLLLQAQKTAETLIGRNFGLLNWVEKEMYQNALNKTSFLTSIVSRGGRHLKFPIKFSMLTQQQRQSQNPLSLFLQCAYTPSAHLEPLDLRTRTYAANQGILSCLLYTSPSPRDAQ